MADNTNAQKIQQFNEESQKGNTAVSVDEQDASGASASARIHGPYQPITATYRMSAADIQLLNTPVDQLDNEQILRREALATKENLRIAQEEKIKQDKEARKAAIQSRNIQKIATGQAANIAEGIGSRAAPAGNWMASRPTPGGIATLLIIISIFLLAVVPVRVGGPTRLKLIWLTITGKTHIDYSADPTVSSNNQQSFTVPTSPVPTPQTGSKASTTIIPNYNPAYGTVIDSAFGLTNL